MSVNLYRIIHKTLVIGVQHLQFLQTFKLHERTQKETSRLINLTIGLLLMVLLH